MKVVSGEETIRPREIDSISDCVLFEPDKSTGTAVNIHTSDGYAKNIENKAVSTIHRLSREREKQVNLGIPTPATSQCSLPLVAQSIGCHASTSEHLCSTRKNAGDDGRDDDVLTIQRQVSEKERLSNQSDNCLARSLLDAAVVEVVEGSLVAETDQVCKTDVRSETQVLTSKRMSRSGDEGVPVVAITDARQRPSLTQRLRTQGNHVISLTMPSSNSEPLEYQKAQEHQQEPSTPPKSKCGDPELQSTSARFILESTTLLNNCHPKESQPDEILYSENTEDAVHDEML